MKKEIGLCLNTLRSSVWLLWVIPLIILVFFEHGIWSLYPRGDTPNYWMEVAAIIQKFESGGGGELLSSLFHERGWRKTIQAPIGLVFYFFGMGSFWVANILFTLFFTFACFLVSVRLLESWSVPVSVAAPISTFIYSLSWTREMLAYFAPEAPFVVLFLGFYVEFFKSAPRIPVLVTYISLAVLVRPIEAGLYLMPAFAAWLLLLKTRNSVSVKTIVASFLMPFVLALLCIFFYRKVLHPYPNPNLFLIGFSFCFILGLVTFRFKIHDATIWLISSIPLFWYGPYIPGLVDWLDITTGSLFTDYTGRRTDGGILSYIFYLTESLFGKVTFCFLLALAWYAMKSEKGQRLKFLIMSVSSSFFVLVTLSSQNEQMRYRSYFAIFLWFVSLSAIRFLPRLLKGFVFFIMLVIGIITTVYIYAPQIRSFIPTNLHANLVPIIYHPRNDAASRSESLILAGEIMNAFKIHLSRDEFEDEIYFIPNEGSQPWLQHLLSAETLTLAFLDAGFKTRILSPYLYFSKEIEDHLKVMSLPKMIVLGPLDEEPNQVDLYARVSAELLKPTFKSELSFERKSDLFVNIRGKAMRFAILINQK